MMQKNWLRASRGANAVYEYILAACLGIYWLSRASSLQIILLMLLATPSRNHTGISATVEADD
jgi:hypothetical protein